MSRARSLVFRTTVLILLFGGVIGALVAWLSADLVARNERERLTQALVEVMATVERTASVAAYARDEQLAAEVVAGLLQNRTVARASIDDGEAELAGAVSPRATAQPQGSIVPLSTPLRSPFDEREVVGTLRVVPAADLIDADAAAYSRFIAVVLAFEVLAITLGVSWVVTRIVTRPIGGLSDDLHRLDVDSGQHVSPPRGHEGDEIGRLARDVNALIDRMGATLSSERHTRELHEAAERKWRLIFDNAQTGLFTLDAEGRLYDWNPWLARVLNLPRRDDRADRFVLVERLLDGEAQFDRMLRDVAMRQASAESDFECRDPRGQLRCLHLVLSPLAGSPGMLQGIVNDVTESRRAEALARAQAQQDALTGLLNRRGFEEAYACTFAHDSRGRGLGLLLVDLDGFKAVNDTHGHEAGDELLIVVARRIESVLRSTDSVARIGGDEFVVLLEMLESVSAARQIAQKLVDVLGKPFQVLDGREVGIGASVGVAYCAVAPADPAELLRRADAAMYEAKKSGKSQYRLAFPI